MGENLTRDLEANTRRGRLLQTEAVQDALSRHPRKLVLDAMREELDETQEADITDPGVFTGIDPAELARSIAQRADRLAPLPFARL